MFRKTRFAIRFRIGWGTLLFRVGVPMRNPAATSNSSTIPSTGTSTALIKTGTTPPARTPSATFAAIVAVFPYADT